MANEFAKQLRKTMTDAERRLWSRLRGGQIGGFKFRKQAPIENYIVDFVCFERKVIVELDGGQHVVQAEEDAKRTAWLNSRGFQVLGSWNHQVFEERDSVVEAIGLALATPHPNPPPQGGRGSDARSEGENCPAAGPPP